MTRDYTAELTAYIDGELGAEDVRALEAALAADPALRALEQRLRRTVHMLKAMPEASADSARLRESLLHELDAQTVSRLPAWFSMKTLVPGVALAAAALVGVVVMQGTQPAGGVSVQDEELLVAQQFDVVEDMDLAGLESPDDLDVIAQLNELEVQR